VGPCGLPAICLSIVLTDNSRHVTHCLFRDDLDVMIKVISYKEDGASELEILKYLSSEPVKSDADNPAVPLLDFLCHDDLKFAVQPRWSSCVEPEFFNVSDGLNFCIQVTKVTDFTQTCFTRDAHCSTGCRIFAPSPHRSFGIFITLPYMCCV
jgi:hypothetical protein